MKLLKWIVIFLLLCSCSHKITEGEIYVTRKYYGRVVYSRILVEWDWLTRGSTLILTDCCSVIVVGNYYFAPREPMYIDHNKTVIIRDNQYQIK